MPPTDPGRILVIGATGMLGRAWAELLEHRRATFATPSRSELDLLDPNLDAALDEALARFDTVVNCAAWTDVDGAEEHETNATRLNGQAVGRLAQACAEHDTTLVHFSTDYVFSGDATRPYPVDAVRDPINAYGRSKAAGEEAIAASGADHLTIRTSWLYAPWGKNFVRTMAKLCNQREDLNVVNDQYGRPTSAQHLAQGALELLSAGARGFTHLTDGGACTWFAFCEEINRLAAAGRCRVNPCSSDQFPRPAKRPAYSVLELAPAEEILGPIPDWNERLAGVIDRLDQD